MKTLPLKVKEAFNRTGPQALENLLLSMADYIGHLSKRVEALEAAKKPAAPKK